MGTLWADIRLAGPVRITAHHLGAALLVHFYVLDDQLPGIKRDLERRTKKEREGIANV